ncbi:TonB-dependent hemoglobin/transferrin/lactoferrin family receptor [Rhodoplanes sp. TEM]|uniref:TonB-dependent hemoglobin/transferrin/lactoferrin family receptor n=1 Tax=Rhodoplanes tepidamans TaxID=200616 RepID=A0ABT5JEA9_RHOTP|nr:MULTISPECIES: TonB-dependent receptor [Rhodoplanes]MDC7788025.1 TonB-dependent hemoglobin/transferrin/lactoferrin family receptor [Rhodoplanes tepidamans]MDC7987896.1 TonB-dependent hemoglobin/transferrin/lactoferrin family receptor [Rhodoplanes sp. TEM]MDQ0353986.1 hemoglobin/transferrin/lactoferrin receptor protein [Rhodoplanes tepidamans]
MHDRTRTDARRGAGLLPRSRPHRPAVALMVTTALVAAASLPAADRARAQATPGTGAAPGAATTVFDIPPQPLAQALMQFSRQTGVQLFYGANLVRGLDSPGVTGAFGRREALARLLAGTGLAHHFTNATTVTLARPGVTDAYAQADGIPLDPIHVTAPTAGASSGAGFQGTPDWVYDAPASISVISREAIQNNPTRSARDLFASMPGVFTSGDNNQNAGINVNIRGLQDQGRVATMIDGARQDFQRSGHGSSGLTYVDPLLLREIDVEKSGNPGVGGVASLAGTVNFRTIRADDIIKPGRRFGVEIDATTGTNAFDFAGMAAGAVRVSDNFSFLAAASHKKIGEYAIGQNGDLGRNAATWALLGVDRPEFMGSRATSTLLKTEMKPAEDVSLDLSWLSYKTKFTYGSDSINNQEEIHNNTVTSALGWDPATPLIDAKARFWFNHTINDEYRPERVADIAPEAFTGYRMKTFGGSLDNTSTLALPAGALSLNYGLEAFRNIGSTTAEGQGIDDDPNMALWYSGANPGGKRDIWSGFGNAKFERDWLTVSGGMRYQEYKLTGTSRIFLQPYTETITREVERQTCRAIPANILALRTTNPTAYQTWYDRNVSNGYTFYPDDTYCSAPFIDIVTEQVTRYPTQDVDVDLSGHAWTPTAVVAVEPVKGIQLFTKYSEGFRPPTIMEAMLGGAHIGSYGPGFAPNPSLKPEESKTWEIGLNVLRNGIFTGTDTFRAKAVGFRRDVENYIAQGAIDLVAGNDTLEYTAYVNLDGTTKMKGLELEANYDLGHAYLGVSYTRLLTDWAKTYTYNGQTYDTEQYVIFVPPKTKYTIDAGVRLLDRRLTIGGRVTHVGVAEDNLGYIDSLVSVYQTESYTVYDLYGSLAITDEAKLRFAVNNLTDLAYVPALGTASLPAPGRTATVSLNFKF